MVEWDKPGWGSVFNPNLRWRLFKKSIRFWIEMHQVELMNGEMVNRFMYTLADAIIYTVLDWLTESWLFQVVSIMNLIIR